MRTELNTNIAHSDSVGTAVGAATAGAAGVPFAAADTVPEPALLAAVTLQLYAVPLVSPVTTMGDTAPLAVIDNAPAVHVTV